ncbi:MAG: Spore protein YabP [Candidatus Dichloromethanomonas elyunquensis]|nr:MAG: Spore protein YabP [Candidatus Dichloromethanomonas elyunquensis]
MGEKREENQHKIMMEDRKFLIITGVKKVKSFDTKEIVLDTLRGGLFIKGQELGVKNLDLEQSEVEIEGQIDVLTYSNNRQGETSKGVWERIFK